VVRSDPSNPADFGRVYIPGDRRLIEMAESILSDIDGGETKIEIITQSSSRGSIRGEREQSAFEVLSTEGSHGGVSDIAGTTASSELVQLAQQYIDRNGLESTSADSLAMLAASNPELAATLKEPNDD